MINDHGMYKLNDKSLLGQHAAKNYSLNIQYELMDGLSRGMSFVLLVCVRMVIFSRHHAFLSLKVATLTKLTARGNSNCVKLSNYDVLPSYTLINSKE